MHCDAFDDANSMDLDMLYEKTVKLKESRRGRWWSLQFPDTKSSHGVGNRLPSYEHAAAEPPPPKKNIAPR
jgi:hypothetical protein